MVHWIDSDKIASKDLQKIVTKALKDSDTFIFVVFVAVVWLSLMNVIDGISWILVSRYSSKALRKFIVATTHSNLENPLKRVYGNKCCKMWFLIATSAIWMFCSIIVYPFFFVFWSHVSHLLPFSFHGGLLITEDLSLSRPYFICAGDKHSVSKGPCVNRGVLMILSTCALGKGGGVLDKPVIEKTTPGRESEFDLRYAYNLCLVSKGKKKL